MRATDACEWTAMCHRCTALQCAVTDSCPAQRHAKCFSLSPSSAHLLLCLLFLQVFRFLFLLLAEVFVPVGRPLLFLLASLGLLLGASHRLPLRVVGHGEGKDGRCSGVRVRVQCGCKGASRARDEGGRVGRKGMGGSVRLTERNQISGGQSVSRTHTHIHSLYTCCDCAWKLEMLPSCRCAAALPLRVAADGSRCSADGGTGLHWSSSAINHPGAIQPPHYHAHRLPLHSPPHLCSTTGEKRREAMASEGLFRPRASHAPSSALPFGSEQGLCMTMEQEGREQWGGGGSATAALFIAAVLRLGIAWPSGAPRRPGRIAALSW